MATSKEIEREVESQRSTVESTLDALKQKMSFGQIADEVSGYVGTEDAKVAFRNVGRQVRDNPIALGLVGVGLAWLMLSGGSSERSDYDDDWDDDRYRTGRGSTAFGDRAVSGGPSYGSAYGSPYSSDERGDRSSEPGMLSRASRAVSDTVHTVGEKLAHAGESVAGAASDVGDRLRSASDDGRRRMHDMRDEFGSHMPSGRAMSDRGRRIGGTLADTIDRQPLMAGAFAMAAGVAIGAALPSTRTEDRWIGERRDELIDTAKNAAVDMQHQAVDAAKAGVRAASDAASEEGLTPTTEGKTLAAKVEKVVKAGVDETKRNLDPDRTIEGAASASKDTRSS